METKSQIYQYTVYYQSAPEGGFNVVVPAIPEICTFGETLEQAKANAREAIECVLESAVKDNELVPMEKDFKFIHEKIQVPLRV